MIGKPKIIYQNNHYVSCSTPLQLLKHIKWKSFMSILDLFGGSLNLDTVLTEFQDCLQGLAYLINCDSEPVGCLWKSL